jgi:hypothetical protein
VEDSRKRLGSTYQLRSPYLVGPRALAGGIARRRSGDVTVEADQIPFDGARHVAPRLVEMRSRPVNSDGGSDQTRLFEMFPRRRFGQRFLPAAPVFTCGSFPFVCRIGACAYAEAEVRFQRRAYMPAYFQLLPRNCWAPYIVVVKTVFDNFMYPLISFHPLAPKMHT